jgi:tetratricopeptide (TPR) repeat protein
MDLMQRGDSALASENTTFAKQLYSAAFALAPDAYLPLLKLGTAFFNDGAYETALDFYSKAYDKSAPRDVTVLYGAALSHEGLNNLPDALGTFGKLDAALPPASELYSDVKFSMGQIRLKMWQKDLSNRTLYKQAVGDFMRFLELRGTPPHWAHYHLACLYATHAAESSGGGEESTLTLNERAASELKETINGVKTNRSRKADLHKNMLSQLLKGTTTPFWPPGNPVICPPLQALSAKLFPDL